MSHLMSFLGHVHGVVALLAFVLISLISWLVNKGEVTSSPEFMKSYASTSAWGEKKISEGQAMIEKYKAKASTTNN